MAGTGDDLTREKKRGFASGFWTHTKAYNEMYMYREDHFSDKRFETGMSTDRLKENLMSDSDFFTHLQSMPFKNSDYFENEYLMKTLWFNSFKALVYTQRMAANNRELYKTLPDERFEKDGEKMETIGRTEFTLPKFAKPYTQTKWSSYHLDFEKDLPVADSSTELEKQLNTIHGYEDRDVIEKEYLTQKAINRFWVGQITKRGGADDLIEFARSTNSSNLLFNMDRSSYGDFAMDTPRAFLQNYKESERTPSKQHLLFPWMNRGEGVIPDGDAPMSELSAAYDSFTEEYSSDLTDAFFLTSHPKVKSHFDDDGKLTHLEVDGEKFSIDEVNDLISDIDSGLGKIPTKWWDDPTKAERASIVIDKSTGEIMKKFDALASSDEARYAWLLFHLAEDNPESSSADREEAIKWLSEYLNESTPTATTSTIVPPTTTKKVVDDEVSVDKGELSENVKDYMKEEHNLDVSTFADLPSYMKHSKSGELHLYGEAQADPHYRSSNGHTMYTPNVISTDTGKVVKVV